MSQTSLANAIDAAGQKARYDAVAKKLVSHKVILAEILRECVDEFKNVSISTIMQECFVGEPKVNTIPVDQDAMAAPSVNSGLPSPIDSSFPSSGTGKDGLPFGDGRIVGSNTEDISASEGMVKYDIRFTVKVPGKFELIHLIINIEIQVVAKPGYAVERRGIYYCARLISAQKGTVFLLLMTNLFDPRTVISQIFPGLQVEKRKKKRPLQMSYILS